MRSRVPLGEVSEGHFCHARTGQTRLTLSSTQGARLSQMITG
jgi:hypothetical protein